MPSTTTAEKAELRRRARQYLSGLSPQARRTSDDALFARFLALPQVEAADTLLLYHGMGASPTPPASSRPLGAGQGGLPAPLSAGPWHGGPACPAGQRADPPPLRDAGAGEDCPWWARTPSALCWCPVWPSTPPAAVWARGRLL
ncbi:MAG: hypothetical protein ACLRIS_01165 [Flavonifractor plautii]